MARVKFIVCSFSGPQAQEGQGVQSGHAGAEALYGSYETGLSIVVGRGRSSSANNSFLSLEPI